MQIFFSKIYFFLLSLFVFLIPLQTVYIFRQGPIGNEGLAREGMWQFGTLAVYATDILFFLIVAIACIYFFLCHSRGSGNLVSQNALIKNSTFLLFILFLISFISILWSPDKTLSIQGALRLFEGAIIFFLLSRLNEKQWNVLAWIFIIGAVLQSILGSIQFFLQEIPAVSWLGIARHASTQLGDAVVENGEFRWLRAYGSFPHPNILAAYLVIGYFFCMSIVMKSEKKMYSLLATLAGVSILFGLVLTFSREAWLGLAAGIIVTMVIRKISHFYSVSAGNTLFTPVLHESKLWHFRLTQIQKLLSAFRRIVKQFVICYKSAHNFYSHFANRSKSTASRRSRFYSEEHIPTPDEKRYISPLGFFSLVSIITLIFFGILFSEPLSVRLGIGGWNRLEKKSVQERVGTIKEFLSFGPALIRGVGIGQYTHALYQKDVQHSTIRASYAYQPVHNAFLMVMAELGVVGLITFMGFLLFLVMRIWKKNPMSIGILISFIIIGFFDHFFWTLHSGILIWWTAIAWLDKNHEIV